MKLDFDNLHKEYKKTLCEQSQHNLLCFSYLFTAETPKIMPHSPKQPDNHRPQPIVSAVKQQHKEFS